MTKAKIGRPRSERSQEAILSATHDLLNENGGAGLTIEAIAKRAKVGKPTIYRWWPTLADIVLEAVLQQADSKITVIPSASFKETLRHFLRLSMKAINDGGGAHLRFLMAHAQKDESFRERFRNNFTAKRREALKAVFLQAMKRKQISQEQNLDMLLDLVFGAMWYRLLIGHASLDDSFADELAGMISTLVQAGSEQ